MKAGITKVGKVLRVLAPLLANFDRGNGVVRVSDWHIKCAEENDIRILMRNLSSSFDVLPNQEYKSFPNPRDPMHARSFEDLKIWIIDHIRKDVMNIYLGYRQHFCGWGVGVC